MKKIIALLLAALMLLSFAGCGKAKTPEACVTDFMEALKKYDVDAMSNCLETPDDAGIPVYENRATGDKALPDTILNHLKDCASKIEYELGEAETDGDSAVIKAKITYIDSQPQMTAALGAYIVKALQIRVDKGTITEEEAYDILWGCLADALAEDPAAENQAEVMFKCVNTGKYWAIKKVPNTILDIYSSNITKAFENLAGAAVEDED